MRLVVISSEQSDESSLLITVINKVTFQTEKPEVPTDLIKQYTIHIKQYSHKKNSSDLKVAAVFIIECAYYSAFGLRTHFLFGFSSATGASSTAFLAAFFSFVASLVLSCSTSASSCTISTS